MGQRIVIPYIQIGDFRIDTPKGLSELLEPCWSTAKENDPVEEFASSFEWSTYRNSDGKLVFKFEPKEGESNENQRSRVEAVNE